MCLIVPDFVRHKANKYLLQLEKILIRYCDDMHHTTRDNYV